MRVKARENARSFLGAVRVAGFNGWSIGFFAVLSLAFGLFSLTSFLVGVGLAVVPRNEFVGRSTFVRSMSRDSSCFGAIRSASWHSSSCIAVEACIARSRCPTTHRPAR
jgi:hypothetical protein